MYTKIIHRLYNVELVKRLPMPKNHKGKIYMWDIRFRSMIIMLDRARPDHLIFLLPHVEMGKEQKQGWG